MNPGVIDGGIKYITKDLWVDYDIAQAKCYPDSGTTINNNLSTYASESGTTYNGPTYSSSKGGTLSFDGSDDYVEINGTGQKEFPNGFTIEFWASPSQNFAAQFYSGKGLAGVSQGSGWTDGWGIGWAQAGIFTTNQCFYFWISDSTYYALYTGGTYDADTMYHVVGTYDGTTVKVYRDATLGFQTYTYTGTWNYPADSRPIHLMKWEGGFYWPGNLYICRIYERALTQTEVTQNYNALKSRFV